MLKTIDFSEFTTFNFTQDICKSIDNSYLSRRISQFDPKNIFESRPRTHTAKHRQKAKPVKIIPELRGAVDILRTRLSSQAPTKGLAMPSSRIKMARKDCGSPEFFHNPQLNKSSYEFSKSPRLQDPITHKISSISYLEIKSFKNPSPGKFEKKNKKQAKLSFDLKNEVLGKIKTHNERVLEVLAMHKVNIVEIREKKKADLVGKIENLKWKENKETLVASKFIWAKIALAIGMTTLMRKKLAWKKVGNI